METRPLFILLCGPTGVGKSKVPKEIFNLNTGAYTKIEIDSLIENNKIYTNSISNIIKSLGKDLILKIIKGQDKDKHLLLTELFNQLYFNVKKNIIPCKKRENINCETLHDKNLASSISNNKTIVLEINGDKDFSWLFVNSSINNKNIFNNKHRNILRKNYEIIVCYLSHNYKKLLASNKDRFLENIEKCNTNECSIRLGNFLLPKIYNETIYNIFKVYNELLKKRFLEKNNINIVFYERTSSNEYLKKTSFKEYQKSFNIVKTIPRVKLTVRVNAKKQKAKSKKNKLKQLL